MGVTRDGVVVVSHGARYDPDLARAANDPLMTRRALHTWSSRWPRSRAATSPNPHRHRLRGPLSRAARRARTPIAETLAEFSRWCAARRSSCGLRHQSSKIDPTHAESVPTRSTSSRSVLNCCAISFSACRSWSSRSTSRRWSWCGPAPVLPLMFPRATGSTREPTSLPDAPIDCGYPIRASSRLGPAHGQGRWRRHLVAVLPHRRSHSVDRCPRLGSRSSFWTVDDQDMRKLIDIGVDGIISDRPDLFARKQAAKGLPLPRPARSRPEA